MSRLWAWLCRLILVVSCGLAGFGLAVFTLRFPAFVLLVVAVGCWRDFRQWRGSGTSHGTARIISLSELLRCGLLAVDGLILGRAAFAAPPTRGQAVRALLSPRVRSPVACQFFFASFLKGRWKGGGLIRLRHFVHLATFAAAGRGKSVSVLVPNLLSWKRSVVVTDPKAELFRLTASHRRQRFGHRIYRLDPFGVGGPGTADMLNPLDFIDANAVDFLDQCRDLANALVIRLGTETEPHWNDSAELVLTAFIAFVCACEEDPAERNLSLVRYLLASRHRYNDAIVKMQQVEGFGGVIASLGHQLTWYVDEELGSVLTTVHRNTVFFDSPAVAACTRTSSFHPRELRSGKVSVFLILPPERLETLAPLTRMWISTLLRVLTQGTASERNPVLFLLDEAGHLGRIQVLENAVTELRGYGIRLWFFFQSLGQVRKCFGDRADIVLDNIDTQQYFGINAYESAEAVSKRAGDATIVLPSLNESSSRSRPDGFTNGQQTGQYSTSRSLNYSDAGRPLWRPDEVLRLPEEMALVFHRSLPVIPVQLLHYFDAPEFRRGRSGASAGLGLAGGFAAAFVLLVSIVIAGTALLLPVPTMPPAANHRAFPPALPPAGFEPDRQFIPPPPRPEPWQAFPGGGVPFGGQRFGGVPPHARRAFPPHPFGRNVRPW